MERIVYKKTLDVHKNGIQFTLQGFETADIMARRIEISLMASGDTIDLPLEQIVAMMYVTTPSATEPSINECTIKGNTIIYDVLPIVEEGITEMQIKLIDTRAEGANGVLAAPKFAIEVTESNTNDEGATQTTTYTALEDAVSKAKGVYDSRLVRIEIDTDCTFRAIYADGTIYESTALNETLLKGEAVLSQSYARGGTGSRNGEDTDNSLYYSNVSRSASVSANKANDNAIGVLKEVQKHGVYTAFSVDFNTGEVKYISPSYTFNINENTGELEAHGEDYNADEVIHTLVTEWLEKETVMVNDMILAESVNRANEDDRLRASLETETIAREQADNDLIKHVDNAKSDTLSATQTAKEEAIAESKEALDNTVKPLLVEYEKKDRVLYEGSIEARCETNAEEYSIPLNFPIADYDAVKVYVGAYEIHCGVTIYNDGTKFAIHGSRPASSEGADNKYMSALVLVAVEGVISDDCPNGKITKNLSTYLQVLKGATGGQTVKKITGLM